MSNINHIKTINRIYDEVFKKLYNDTCYVFLCGGVGENCIRDKVRVHLERNNIQVLYPEDLFIEMLNRNKSNSLLDYENILGKSSNYVLLICESYGSAAELGAFVQNDEIRKKLLVGINKKFIRDNSFIMGGPVKSVIIDDDSRVFEYDMNNLSGFYNGVLKRIKKRYSVSLDSFFSKSEPDFELLPTYISLIPILLFFYHTITRREIFHNLKQWLIENDKCPNDYNELFNAAIKYLLKLGIITVSGVVDVEKELNEQILELSKKGLKTTNINLSKSSISYKNMLQDEIRYDILKEQLNS